jgi:hypothetical protein
MMPSSGGPALAEVVSEQNSNNGEGSVMLSPSIRRELQRLNLHPVNLDVVSEIDDNVLLRGSLLGMWQVPKSIDGRWFLKMLTCLPDSAGPKATMDAYYDAYMAEGAGRV